jgi:hypothetical protein
MPLTIGNTDQTPTHMNTRSLQVPDPDQIPGHSTSDGHGQLVIQKDGAKEEMLLDQKIVEDFGGVPFEPPGIDV